jgi:hypothetical protein
LLCLPNSFNPSNRMSDADGTGHGGRRSYPFNDKGAGYEGDSLGDGGASVFKTAGLDINLKPRHNCSTCCLLCGASDNTLESAVINALIRMER